MASVAVVVDSIACLTREMVEQYGVKVLPLNFYVGDRIYRDWVDVTPSEAYELFLKDPDSFKTSSVSPGECLEAYREVSQKADNIICITVSTKISAVNNSATEAKKQVLEELPRLSIEVFDSRTCAAAEGFIALAAARAASEGKDLAEVVKAAEEVRERASFLIFLDTMRHVYRSGRIPKIASQAGSLLSVRPILTTASGVLHFTGMARSKKSGVEKLLRMMRERVGSNPVHVAVTHAYTPDDAEALKERISSEFNCSELWISEFSPLMAYACGTGALGVAFYSED
ncbi:MAG: DegV family protein [Dehalococcoidales bacterium]|nr:MAG: DegV family protein [Dehalococcoidales bacterium]